MADDDRKVLFLSFANTLKMIDNDRITKWKLSNGNIYYRELAEGLYYLDYGETLIYHPEMFNYEEYFSFLAHKILKIYLKSFKARQPSAKAQLIGSASNDEERTMAQEYVGHVLYREPGTDRQLKYLNMLLVSNSITPIHLGDASNFQQGIAVLRRRCIFKEIVE